MNLVSLPEDLNIHLSLICLDVLSDISKLAVTTLALYLLMDLTLK